MGPSVRNTSVRRSYRAWLTSNDRPWRTNFSYRGNSDWPIWTRWRWRNCRLVRCYPIPGWQDILGDQRPNIFWNNKMVSNLKIARRKQWNTANNLEFRELSSNKKMAYRFEGIGGLRGITHLVHLLHLTVPGKWRQKNYSKQRNDDVETRFDKEFRTICMRFYKFLAIDFKSNQGISMVMKLASWTWALLTSSTAKSFMQHVPYFTLNNQYFTNRRKKIIYERILNEVW